MDGAYQRHYAPRVTASPETSSSFAASGLHEQLVQRLGERGLSRATPVQDKAIGPARNGTDVLMVAPTGTGKTLSYLLPVADALLRDRPPTARGFAPGQRLRALVLCPTRELAMQVAAEAEWLLRGSVLRVGCVYGKSPVGPQRAMLLQGVDLLIGTPGRVRDLAEDGSLPTGAVAHVVVDEADRLWDMGFAPQIQWILQRLPESRQTLAATATMPQGVAKELLASMRDPVRVEAAPPNTLAATGPGVHGYFDVDDPRKVPLLLHLIVAGKRKGVAVYVRTRRRADWVSTALERNGVKAALLHGDIPQHKRTKALALFTHGQVPVLVATDVAARGLHIGRLRCVVNYDIPLMPEDFVHRVGRAGHGGGTAESLTFVSPEDADRWAKVAALLHAGDRGAEAPAVERQELPTLDRADHASRRVGAPKRAELEPAPDDESKERRTPGRRATGDRASRSKSSSHSKFNAKSKRPHGQGRPSRGGPGGAGKKSTFGALHKKPGRAARAPISGKPGSGARAAS